MQKKLLSIVATFAIVVAATGVLNQSAFAVPISPDKYFVDIQDNSVVNNEITIFGKQNQKGTKTVYLTVLGMKKAGETDARNFTIVDSSLTEELSTSIQLSKSEAKLAPGETIVVPWTITPNPDLKCGTNLAAIVVTETPVDVTENNGASAVSFKSEVISQIHANVNFKNGKICDNNTTNLSLVEFKIDQGVSTFDHGNVPFITRIQNTGNLIARDPRGFIEIFGFGNKITLPFNPDGLDVYPGTTRLFKNAWIDKDYPVNGNFFSQFTYELTHLRIGKYEAKLGVTKNVNPSQIVDSVFFWIVPWKIVFLLFLILAVIVVLVGLLVKMMMENKKLSEKISTPVQTK